MKSLKYLMHGAVILGLIVAGVKYVDGEQFWRAIRQFDWAYIAPVLLLTLVYFGIKAYRFLYFFRQLHHADGWMVLRAYVAGQACSVLPGGVAMRAGLLKEAGVPIAASTPPIVLSSLCDCTLLIVSALIAALWFEAARKPLLLLLSGLIVVSALLGIQATRMWILAIVERLMGKFNLLEHWQGFLASSREVTRLPILLNALGMTAVTVALMVYVLELCLHATGAHAPVLTLLLAFALPSVMGRMSALPAGVGVTEAGMVGILNASPGISIDQAAAAVTVFRMATVLFEALVGGLVYMFAWRGSREAPEGEAPSAPTPAETPISPTPRRVLE